MFTFSFLPLDVFIMWENLSLDIGQLFLLELGAKAPRETSLKSKKQQKMCSP